MGDAEFTAKYLIASNYDLNDVAKWLKVRFEMPSKIARKLVYQALEWKRGSRKAERGRKRKAAFRHYQSISKLIHH